MSKRESRIASSKGGKKSKSLEAEFREVCERFFPRWRAASSWVLKEGPRALYQDASGRTCATTENGYCDRESRTIWVNDSSSRRLTIIHECAHAVTLGGHGKRFCLRLRQAAERAETLGELPLREALLNEAGGYESQSAMRAGDIYEMVNFDDGILAFDQVVQYITVYIASTGPELIEQYPRLRRVYDAKIRDEIRVARRQLKLVQGNEALTRFLLSRIIALEDARGRSANAT